MQESTKIKLQYLAAKTFGLTTKQQDKIRILTYHSIYSHSDKIRHISPELFEEHICFLHQSGYKSFRVCDIASSWPEILNEKHAIIITLDDGLSNNREFACPILRKYNMTATFFVPTAYIGNKRSPSRASEMGAYAEMEMMSWQDLHDIMDDGFEIGAHSHNHVKISQQNQQQAISEVELPKKILENKLGRSIYSFAYPKGRNCSFAAWTRELLIRSGYHASCTTLEGFLHKKTDLMALPRIDIAGSDDINKFQMKLEGYYDCLKYLRQLHRFTF